VKKKICLGFITFSVSQFMRLAEEKEYLSSLPNKSESVPLVLNVKKAMG